MINRFDAPLDKWKAIEAEYSSFIDIPPRPSLIGFEHHFNDLSRTDVSFYYCLEEFKSLTNGILRLASGSTKVSKIYSTLYSFFTSKIFSTLLNEVEPSGVWLEFDVSSSPRVQVYFILSKVSLSLLSPLLPRSIIEKVTSFGLEDINHIGFVLNETKIVGYKLLRTIQREDEILLRPAEYAKLQSLTDLSMKELSSPSFMFGLAFLSDSFYQISYEVAVDRSKRFSSMHLWKELFQDNLMKKHSFVLSASEIESLYSYEKHEGLLLVSGINHIKFCSSAVSDSVVTSKLYSGIVVDSSSEHV